MSARNVSIHLKSNMLSDSTRTFEKDFLPLLRKQNGFKILFLVLAATLALPTLAHAQWFELQNDNLGTITVASASGSDYFGSNGLSGACSLTTGGSGHLTVTGYPSYLQPYGTFRTNWTLTLSSSGSFYSTYRIACGNTAVFGANISGTYTPPPQGIQGYINPKYVVVGVTYAPPGPTSNVTYTNSTLVGNTTTTTNSFKNNVNVTISVTKDISAWTVLGAVGVKLAGTSSTDVTQGTNSSSTVTTSKTSTVSYQTSGTGNACSPVNHDYDTIWLWLNPLALYTAYSGTTNVQWNGYGYDNHDPAGTNGRDIVPIQVGWLNGHFGSDPSINAILARGWVTTYEPTMIWPAGEGPGITSTDKTHILAADPFTNPTYTLPTPLPTSSADGRFTQDLYPPNPIPYIPGGTTTAYSTVDLNTNSQANGTSYEFVQAFGTELSFKGTAWLATITVDIKTTDTMTQDQTWLNTLTVTQTNTNSLSVAEPSNCNPPYSGPGQFIVFQDNHYGSFMFYPVI
jgi:hypothetical protein